MAIPVWRFGICYYPAPKVANTSLKHVMHRLRTGAGFVGEEKPDGGRTHIHQAYGTPLFSKVEHEAYADMLRFAVVRDPIDRLLSTWGNRVVHHGELSEAKADAASMRAKKLAFDPDLTTFLDRLEDYLEMSRSVRLHALPLVEFLGPSPQFFHLLFDISQLPQLVQFLQATTGREITLPHRQADGPKARRDDLTPAQIRKLEAHYATDYESFGDAMRSIGGGVRKSRPGFDLRDVQAVEPGGAA
jgi:hypothetical protein